MAPTTHHKEIAMSNHRNRNAKQDTTFTTGDEIFTVRHNNSFGGHSRAVEEAKARLGFAPNFETRMSDFASHLTDEDKAVGVTERGAWTFEDRATGRTTRVWFRTAWVTR
jgi:hypothetical protein